MFGLLLLQREPAPRRTSAPSRSSSSRCGGCLSPAPNALPNLKMQTLEGRTRTHPVAGAHGWRALAGTPPRSGLPDRSRPPSPQHEPHEKEEWSLLRGVLHEVLQPLQKQMTVHVPRIRHTVERVSGPLQAIGCSGEALCKDDEGRYGLPSSVGAAVDGGVFPGGDLLRINGLLLFMAEDALPGEALVAESCFIAVVDEMGGPAEIHANRTGPGRCGRARPPVPP